MNDIIVVCICECRHWMPASKSQAIQVIVSHTISHTLWETTRSIPHYIIILSLTFVPPAASCYKGVCHFMCSRSGCFFPLSLSLSLLPTPIRLRSNDKEKKLWYIKKRNVSKERCVFSVDFVLCALTWVDQCAAKSMVVCWLSWLDDWLALDSHFITHIYMYDLVFWFGNQHCREIDGMALILRRLICWMGLLFLPL